MAKINFTSAVLCLSCQKIEAAIPNGQNGGTYKYFDQTVDFYKAAAKPADLKDGVCAQCRPLERLKSRIA